MGRTALPKGNSPRPHPGAAGAVLPAVRIASAHELAAAARAAPLLRQALRLARWVGSGRPLTAAGLLRPADAIAAVTELDLAGDDGTALPETGRLRSAGDVRELDLLWHAALGAGLIAVAGRRATGHEAAVGEDDAAVLAAWRGALGGVLRSGPAQVRAEVEGLATVLYAAGAPVRMDVLTAGFAGAARRQAAAPPGRSDPQARMSHALEVLADLGAAELGIDEEDDQLTVALTPLGVAGLRDRLVAAGFSAPVLGTDATGSAADLIAGLAACDAEEGEREVAAWLAQRTPQEAAAELLRAAGNSSPGARGAAFAIIDRLGDQVVPLVRKAMADPVLRPHAAIWLREHGAGVELSAAEKAWLLVDLGAGLLEEADPAAVAAELLPDLPPAQQAELVGGLWRVTHPDLIALLTTLTKHHPEPGVAKAARKAALRARSRRLGIG